MKYKVEVIADNSGVWCGNGKEFDTFEEAKAYGIDLWSRWTLVRKVSVVTTDPEVKRVEVDL